MLGGGGGSSGMLPARLIDELRFLLATLPNCRAGMPSRLDIVGADPAPQKWCLKSLAALQILSGFVIEGGSDSRRGEFGGEFLPAEYALMSGNSGTDARFPSRVRQNVVV